MNWEQSRLIFIAPEFTKYQLNAIGHKVLRISLWEVKKYGNGILSYNEIKPIDKEERLSSIIKGNSIPKKTSSVIRSYSRESLLESLVKEKRVLENTFPVKVTYDKISKINIDNPSSIKIASSKLILEPFYKIRYFITNKNKYVYYNSRPYGSNGDIILNANTGRIEGKENIISNIWHTSSKFKEFLSKTGLASETSNYDESISEDLINSIQYNDVEKICEFTTNGQFEIIENNVYLNIDTVKELFDSISNELVSPNEKLEIEEPDLIYIPKWFIEFKGNNRSYFRIAWAHIENHYIKDDLQSCPMDNKFSKLDKICMDELKKRKLIAFRICDICGICYCNIHSNVVGNHSYCNNHSSSQMKEHLEKQL